MTAQRGIGRCPTLCLLVLLHAAPALPQDGGSLWYARAYRTEDGLPSSVIHAIAQDQNGYLWLGTASGLVRFDGTQFVEWGRRGDSAPPVNSILALAVGHDGSLWLALAGSGGVQRLFEGKLTTYTSGDGPVRAVYTVIEDRRGTIWAGGRDGLSRLSGGHWQRLGRDHGLTPGATLVNRLYEDRQGAIWAATASGVFRSRNADTFERVSTDVVRDFAEDADGRMWGTDEHTGYRRLGDPRAATTPARVAAAKMGRRIFFDHRGHLWVGTMGGLWQVRDPAHPAPPIEHFAPREGVIDSPVQALFRDREGTIWVGTRGGLFRFFEHEVTVITSDEGLLSNTIGAVETTPDGKVWVGTVDGLSAFSWATGTERAVNYPWPGLRVSSLHSDSTGRLWVATEDSIGVFENGRFDPLRLPEGVGRPLSITSDADGLWLCHGSLSRLQHGEVLEFRSDPAIARKACTAIYTDRHGQVWVGFGDGSLGVYEGGRFRLYSQKDGLPASQLSTLYGDEAGALWVATYDGVSRLKDGRFTTLGERNGFPGRKVTSIIDDESGDLWLALNAGIVRVSKTEFDRVAVDPSHRIQYALFNAWDGVRDAPSIWGTPSSTRGPDGRLWFPTAKGVAIVDPRRVRSGRPPALVQIERVIADGRAFESIADGVTLPPRPSTVQIDYTAVSLSAASKVRFAYMLEGFDSGWVDAAARRQAFYTRIPPGRYRFHVRASVDGREQSTAVRELSVTPAFFQQAWFYAASAGFVGLLVWGAWRVRLRALREQFALVLAERARIAREIHDTVLQGMAGVAMQIEGVARKLDASPGVAKEELHRVRRQLRQHIEEARETILAVRVGAHSRSLEDALREFGDRNSHGGHRVELVVSGTPFAAPADVERELMRIGQEAIRNAIRHAEAPHVRVELHYGRHDIRLLVSDDGRGFDPDQSSFGGRPQWGLIGMRERAKKISGQLHIVSQPGGGTRVEVSVHPSAVEPSPEPAQV